MCDELAHLLILWNRAGSRFTPSSITGALAAMSQTPHQSRSGKTLPGRPVTTHTWEKKQIDYCLIYDARQGNPLTWLWNNYNLRISVGITTSHIFSLNYVKTTKVWTEIHFNRYLSSIIKCVFPILCFSHSLQRDVPLSCVCLRALATQSFGDGFNCNTTTTRKAQNPHKSKAKLAAVPLRSASHAIITGKRPRSLSGCSSGWVGWRNFSLSDLVIPLSSHGAGMGRSREGYVELELLQLTLG